MEKSQGLNRFRLFSPLQGWVYFQGAGCDSEDPEVISSRELCEYTENILELIKQRHLEKEGERGLAIYLYDEVLEKKIYSMKPTVNIWQGELFGVLEVESYDILNDTELQTLIKEWRGQESDGWGEGLEQQAVKIEDGELYVSFWQPNSSFFIKTELDLKGFVEQPYDGLCLPEQMKKHGGLIALQLESASCTSKPKTRIWLELPANGQVILQAIKTIGGISLDDCIIADCQSVLQPIDNRFLLEVDINKINLLAKRLASFSEQELKKYNAVLTFEYYAELDDMLDLTHNLDCYDHDPEITNPAGYAESVLQKAGINIGDPAFSSFDFYGLGLRLLEKRGIMSTPYGIVKRNENPFKHELTSSYQKMTPV